MSNSQQPTANSQQPTANSQQPTANSQQPTAKLATSKSFLYASVLGVMLGVSACGGGGGSNNSPATSSGDSNSSNTVAPSAFAIQSITKKANHKADVNWLNVTGASTYTVHLAKAPFTGQTASDYANLAGYQKFENLTGNTTEVTLDGNSVYHIIVTASNGTSQIASSAEKTTSYTALALNDTSITKCGDYAFDNTASTKPHNNNRDCTQTTDADGDPIPAGQDGHYATGYKNASGEAQKGKNFTKVAGYEDKCVQDKHTGLMWEVKQTDAGLHHKDNTYTWYNPDNTTNGGSAGTQYTSSCTASSGKPCNTQAFVEAVNQVGWCGFKDWRLPTREELRSIVDYSQYNPAVDVSYFPNANDFYWTSSPYVGSDSDVWGWYLNYGLVEYKNRNKSARILLVRAR